MYVEIIIIVMKNVYQVSALRKIKESPVLWTCEIQGAQHIIQEKKVRFLVSWGKR